VPSTLAEIVRRKLHAGTLPHEQPLKLWANVGSGKPCTACDAPIVPSQTEYEAQYYDGRPPIFLHVACHQLWEVERNRVRV
jgi:hypothetical protein